MKNHKKKIIIGVIVLIIIGFVWYKFSFSDKEEVESYVVKKGSVEKTLSVSGNIEPKEYVDLSFETPALVSWVGVEVGEKVEKGQALMRLDKSSLWANVKEAQVALEKAIEGEKLARRKWDLYKPEEKEQFKKTSEQARLNLESIKAQYYKSTLNSPIEGIVTQVNAKKGEVAQGAVIRVINEGKQFEVEALVSEADIAEIFVGQEAEVTFDAFTSDEKFSAEVSKIDPEATNVQDVVYFKSTFELDEIDERVRSGMTVDVDILSSQKDNVLVVPLRFIRRDDEGSYVFVKKNQEEQKGFFTKESAVADNAEKRYVKTGIESDDGLMEIVDGVSEEEEVVSIYED